MTRQRVAIARRIAVIIVIAVVAVAAVSITIFTQEHGSTTCTFSAYPLALGIRVVSDTNQTPIAGASVAATGTPTLCDGIPATSQEKVTFVTNGSEWYYLPSVDYSTYKFVVGYSGHSYDFSQGLGIEDVTCVSLSIP